MEEYVVQMQNIVKQFGDFQAIDDMSLSLKKGEIHALLGENGAGKSTLMSILFGLYAPTSGIIKINGKEVKISNPNIAEGLGIGMVHQHFRLVDCFSVLDNIMLGNEPVRFGILDRKKALLKVNSLIDKYKLKVDPNAIVASTSVGMQQRVEILKMLYRDNDILILDEPTAVLTPQETDELIDILKKFAQEGKSILFISHKLKEIMRVADRCTIIRKGKYIGTYDVKNTSEEELSSKMVGRKVDLNIEKKSFTPGGAVLRIENLTVKSKLNGGHGIDNVSFEVRAGEILSIAGIDGNGQNELVEAITGLSQISAGKIYLAGKDITDFSVRKRNELGIGHIPEDRLKYGIISEYSLGYNIVLQKYFTDKFSSHGFLDEDKVKSYATELIEKYDVRTSQGSDTLIGKMSGGNQQKAVIARELDKNPDLIIAVQPIRGLDVGAIEYIHKKILSERDKGKAVLLVSFDLNEVMSLSDRILVLYNGQISGEFNSKEVTSEELGLCMIGGGEIE